ncbi:MAG: hypothetical protein ABI379_13970 [Rhodanobacter sp.]
MTKNNGFKVAALAASIALAMAATSAMAAGPAAGQLPGQGANAMGAPTVSVTASTMAIALTANSVINWGTGTDYNKTGVAGFNIGAGGTVNVTGGFALLNIDSTGGPSQIFGTLGAAGNVYVANSNGIIVGSGGSITSGGEVGLLGNTTFGNNAGFTGSFGSLTFNGTGGDVIVMSGAALKGASVFISGGGNVNVDLGALQLGAATLSAGLSQNAAPATSNASANLAITGGPLGGGTIAAFNSGGTASNAATLDLSGAAVSVKGTLSNTGVLTLGAANGTVVNQGQLTTAGAATFDSLTNAGAYSAAGITINSGGSLTNTGSITGAGAVVVNDGAINNAGSISGVTSLSTQSDSGGAGYVAAGQDYINNTGSISGTAGLTINVNTTRVGGTANTSTGSFTNTGMLNVAAAGDALSISANNNVMLGGTLQAGATPKALSAANPLGAVTLMAGGGATPFTGKGALVVTTPIFGAATNMWGPQVAVMSNVTSSAGIGIIAGAASTTDYAVRVGAGVKVTAAAGQTLTVDGDQSGDNPNVILQGQLSGDTITLGGANSVSDVFSGPNGGLMATGATPVVTFDFTGRVKTAPYLNDANFRYNYLQIMAPNATSPVALTLNPTAYTTNSTTNGLSAVNILVDADVTLMGVGAGTGIGSTIDGTGLAVTGVNVIPNTHLVLQSTGNIATNVAYFWPGYVYLGNIGTNTDGSAAPGTLNSTNTITLGGDFSNVLPGDVTGASGIHFMTGAALVAGAGTKITTNANAWVNFPTYLLTQDYAQGVLTNPSFYGGVATGLIVNYGKLSAADFNLQPVNPTM